MSDTCRLHNARQSTPCNLMQVLNTDCKLTQQWQKSCSATKKTLRPTVILWTNALECMTEFVYLGSLQCWPLTVTSFLPSNHFSAVFCAHLPHLHPWSACSLRAVYWCALIEHECLIVFLKHCFSWSVMVLSWYDTVGVDSGHDSKLKLKLGLMQFYQLMLSTDWLWLGFYRMMNSVLKTVDYRSEHWYKSDVRNVSEM